MTGIARPGVAAGASPSGSGRLGWQDNAACIGKGDLFFGPEGEGPLELHDRERVAKRICADCEVRMPCAQFRESLPPDMRRWGVYGGIGEKDRRHMLRRRAAAARGDGCLIRLVVPAAVLSIMSGLYGLRRSGRRP
jgi:WhiB family transcriptional regulator, redox-sensing transcriptional regulator